MFTKPRSDYFKGRPASLLIQSQARPTRRGVKRESIESIKPAPVGENGLQKQSKAEEARGLQVLVIQRCKLGIVMKCPRVVEESAPNIESGDSIDVLDRFEGYTLPLALRHQTHASRGTSAHPWHTHGTPHN